MRKYTNLETFRANIPYAAMVLLGTIAIAFVLEFSVLGLAAAGIYFVYGIVGTLWIIVFVCPYCRYYATKECPCGYGTIAERFVKKGERDLFKEKFKRHIPVIVPLWILPVVCLGIGLWQSFSWLLIGFLAVFIFESWIVLPIVSKKHGCIDCPQKEECPWMGKGG